MTHGRHRPCDTSRVRLLVWPWPGGVDRSRAMDPLHLHIDPDTHAGALSTRPCVDRQEPGAAGGFGLVQFVEHVAHEAAVQLAHDAGASGAK